MIGFGQFRGVEFIRLITVNATNTKEDILNFFRVMEEYVSENEHELRD